MSQPVTVLVTVAFLAGICTDRAYLHAKLRLMLWNESDDGYRFNRWLRNLAVMSLILFVAVMVLQH
jgi:hypothetical protein